MPEYISRETLRDLMYTEAFERDTGLQRWDSGLWIRYKLFENCVDAIPAADVRPVVKAYWTNHRTIEHDGEWYCSACGKEITIYMGADRKDRYMFCPNCGAMMDGGRRE